MTRNEARKKAEALVDRMTVEEMTTQLRFDAKEIKRLDIPEYNWWSEGIHGVARAGSATIFPQVIGLAATFDEEMSQKVADIVSTEARAKYNAYSAEGDRDIFKGLTLWSPNINIFRDPRWGRGHETYGEDPYLTSRMGVAHVKGLQGNGDTLKTAACAKHFAVHSGPEALRHEFNATVTQKDMYETYLPAFEACVREGDVESVMGAYNRTNNEPCCAHTDLMVNILRGKWGFKGHFVSDCWAIKDFHEHHMVTNNPRESVALALKKGCDLNCGSSYLCMMQAYNEGKITKEEIRTACVRLFTTRYLLGLFEISEYDNLSYADVETKEHLQYAYEAAAKSIVLLKNDGILPLNKEKIKSIAVIGPNANSRSALIGNYHGTASRYWTVTEGLQNATLNNDIRIYTSEGCHLFKGKVENLGREDDRITEAVAIAKLSDVVVLCVGLDETLEGEEGDTGNSYASGDKADLKLPECQQNLVEALKKVGKPIVLLNMTGSAMDLSYAKYDDAIGAILQTWYPGAEGGRAIADILFGKVSPSGKLPVTFYNTLEELPKFADYTMKGRTYRYMENDAQYAFGYGLTYSRCEVKNALIRDFNKDEFNVEDMYELSTKYFEIEVTVANEGSAGTDEVVQIYIKNKDSKYAVRNVSLCGFKRINTEAGKITKAIVKIPYAAFIVFDDEGKKIIDGKSYTLYAGISQPDNESVKLLGTRPYEIEISI